MSNKKLDLNEIEVKLKNWYKKVTRKDLDLDEPKTFNEKIQWLKLYDSTPLKTRLADKYLVREWIKEQIGEEYLIPLLGAYDKFEDIDFDKLPDSFVIKCNHGAGYNIVVKDKNNLDLNEVKDKINRWLGENYGLKNGYELHYVDISPKIIIEQYIFNKSITDLRDYKFWCFNGEPKFLYTIIGRESGKTEMVTYDMNWNNQNIRLMQHIDGGGQEKPLCFEKMYDISRKLSRLFSLARIDLYLMDDGKIYFGEITFTPGSGIDRFNNESVDLFFGNLINLPKVKYDFINKKYIKQPNKLFSIVKEKYKTRYYFLGFKYVRFNTRREILDLIKSENQKLIAEFTDLKNQLNRK